MPKDLEGERQLLDAKVNGVTIPLALNRAAEQHPEIRALNWKQDGEWKGFTFPELNAEIRKVTNGLLALGISSGEFLVILARNIPEHYLADYGTVHARGVPVSLYNSSAPEQMAYIINHCEASFMVVENESFLEKVLKVRDEIPTVRKVILVEPGPGRVSDDWVISWDDLLAEGERFGASEPEAFERSWRQVTPSDLLTLIYTSGTTGPPKGVMLDHRNVAFAAHSLDTVGKREPGDKLISYLPLAHVAERTTTMYIGPILAGAIYCCPDLNELLPTLLEVKPQVFFGVPRVFEKMHAGVQARIAGETDEAKKTMVKYALDIGQQAAAHRNKRVEVPEEVRQQLETVDPILGLIRAGLGFDEIRYAISGAAPIAPEVLEWFHSIGVQVQEIYGQSEGSGPTSLNPPGGNKLGTVGPALPGVEVKLAEDGEILVRGDNVARGYYKDEELTKQTFDEDGWLHSGDIGEIDEEGYVRIVDRKKEIIITSGGKNVAPSNIETALKHHPLVGQAAVIGDRRPYVTALIVLDPETAPVWASSNGISSQSLEDLAKDPVVLEEIDRWVAETNKQFSSVEQVKRYTVLGAEWTPETEELTPTMKLKRRVIDQRYADEIEAMYVS